MTTDKSLKHKAGKANATVPFATEDVISPLQIRTRPIRNVAPVVRVERGVTAQHVAA